MRTLASTIILFLLGLLTLALIIASNLWIVLSSPEQIKNLAEKSSVYETAAFYIKESIIVDKNLTLDESTVLEQLNEAVTTDFVRSFLNRTLDQIFLALKDPSNPSFELDLSLPGLKVPGAEDFAFRQTVSLEGNPAVLIYSLIPKAFLALGLLLLLLLTSLWLLGRSIAGKLKWLSGALFYSGILTLLFGAFFLYFLPQYSEKIVASLNLVADPKLLNGMKRLLESAIDAQKIYYYLETIGLFFLAAIFYFLGGILSREKEEVVDLQHHAPKS